MHQYVHHGFHLRDAGKFKPSMAVGAAGGKVGAGKAHKRQPRAIGAAADGGRVGLNTAGTESILCPVEDFHLVFQHFPHIIIGVRQEQADRVVSIYTVEVLGDFFCSCFLFLKFCPVMVPDDIVHTGRFFASVHSFQMVKPFIILGVHGVFPNREHPMEFHSHQKGVNHFSLSRTGMDAAALNGNL